MTTDEEQRGREAESVLSNRIYQEAYSHMEGTIVNILAKQATKPEEAEDLRRLLIALRKVKGYMEQVMKTGVMAEMERERKLTMMERFTGRAVA